MSLYKPIPFIRGLDYPSLLERLIATLELLLSSAFGSPNFSGVIAFGIERDTVIEEFSPRIEFDAVDAMWDTGKIGNRLARFLDCFPERVHRDC